MRKQEIVAERSNSTLGNLASLIPDMVRVAGELLRERRAKRLREHLDWSADAARKRRR